MVGSPLRIFRFSHSMRPPFRSRILDGATSFGTCDECTKLKEVHWRWHGRRLIIVQGWGAIIESATEDACLTVVAWFSCVFDGAPFGNSSDDNRLQCPKCSNEWWKWWKWWKGWICNNQLRINWLGGVTKSPKWIGSWMETEQVCILCACHCFYIVNTAMSIHRTW